MAYIQGPHREDDLPIRNADGERVYASADPFAGTDADNGKDIWDVPTIAANLNRTEWDWYTNNYGELDDGVLTYGFWEDAEEIGNSYYASTTLPIAFAETNPATFSAFNDDQIAATKKAIALWDDLIDIRFEQTSAPDSDLAYGNTNTGGAQAYAYLPFGDIFDDYEVYETLGFEEVGRLSGDVWVDGFVTSNFFPIEDSFYSITTLIHETGHSLGLSHPGDYDALDDNDGDGVPDPISYANDAFFYQDSLQYSIMSYWDAYETGAQHIDWELARFGYAATPLVHDIAAAQAIYGADMTTRTGDTVYGFNSTAGRSAFDFETNTVPIVSIWDAGGTDTLDLSGYDTNSLIDLNEGAFSSAGGIEEFLTLEQVNANRAEIGLPARNAATWQFYEDLKAALGLENGLLKDNISIAYGTTIENAVGGGGGDVLIGNGVANMLSGGDGVDRFTGNGGNDIFVAEVNATKVASKDGPLSLDIILDFARGGDKIDLSGIDANSLVAGHQAFKWDGKSNGIKAGDLYYKAYGNVHAAEKVLGVDIDGDGTANGGPKDGRVTVVFGNTDGDRDPEIAIVLLNNSDVTAADFMFG